MIPALILIVYFLVGLVITYLMLRFDPFDVSDFANTVLSLSWVITIPLIIIAFPLGSMIDYFDFQSKNPLEFLTSKFPRKRFIDKNRPSGKLGKIYDIIEQ